MPEVTDAGEDHRKPCRIGSRDNRVVAFRSARLNDAGNAGFCGIDNIIREYADANLRYVGRVGGKEKKDLIINNCLKLYFTIIYFV